MVASLLPLLTAMRTLDHDQGLLQNLQQVKKALLVDTNQYVVASALRSQSEVEVCNASCSIPMLEFSRHVPGCHAAPCKHVSKVDSKAVLPRQGETPLLEALPRPLQDLDLLAYLPMDRCLTANPLTKSPVSPQDLCSLFDGPQNSAFLLWVAPSTHLELLVYKLAPLPLHTSSDWRLWS